MSRSKWNVRTAACLSIALVSLPGCANKQQAGELIGAGIGLAAGIALGSGDAGKTVGALAGALIGSMIGGLIGSELDEQDRKKANEAAMAAAGSAQGMRVNWVSDRTPKINGYAEVVSAPAPSISNTYFCYDPKINFSYSRTTSGCAQGDQSITEEQFRQHQESKSNISRTLPTKPVTVKTAEKKYCYDPKIKFVYYRDTGNCVAGDRQIEEAQYLRVRDRPSGSPVKNLPSNPTPIAATPVSTEPVSTCRRVREVVILDGNETRTEADYCLRGGQWTRA